MHFAMAQKLSDFTTAQLTRALELRQQIDALQNELNALEGTPVEKKRGRPPGKGRKKLMAAEKPARKGRRKMSAAAKATLSAAAKTRWAKAKAAGKRSL